MAVYYNDGDGFAFMPDDCDTCDVPLYDTGCDAPDCSGRMCPECGHGCDREVLGDAGRCGRAAAAESDEDYTARVNRERAAFGLGPVGDTEVSA